MNRTSLVIGLVALLIVAGGAFAIMKPKAKVAAPAASPTTSVKPTPNTPPAITEATDTKPVDAMSATAITYSGSGFTPTNVTIKAGDTITVKNTSTRSLEFNSDPHPTHTNNAELNVGNIGAGASKSITVNKPGTWGYHNHLNPTEKGSIIVQ